MVRILLISIFLYFCLTYNLLSQHYHLVSGDGNELYLCCITCSEYNSNSIWNQYGTYGSKYSNLSIWNKHGTYGSKFTSYSPWNTFSLTPPYVVDDNGDYYGEFTSNKFNTYRTQIKWFLEILDNYDYITKNFDKYVKNLKLR